MSTVNPHLVREGDELPGDLYLGGGCPAGTTRDLGYGYGPWDYQCMGAPGHGRNGEPHYAAGDSERRGEFIAAVWGDDEAAAHFRDKAEKAARDHAAYERDRRRFLGLDAPSSPVTQTLSDAELIAEASEWVAECSWKEDPEAIEEYSDAEIKRGVNRHYDGGWAGFVRDCHPEPATNHPDGPRRNEKTMSTATSEATTLGAAQVAAQALDEKAQECEQTGDLCARGAQAMTQSQASLDAALTRFQLDRRTLAAAARLQEATHGLEEAAARAGGSARELSAASQTLLERLGGHRRLAQAVQEHGEAAQQDWYRGGR